jgi:hypothetical protein
MPLITISASYGAGGSEIGPQLAHGASGYPSPIAASRLPRLSRVEQGQATEYPRPERRDSRRHPPTPAA